MSDINDMEDWELEAAEDVVKTWEGILIAKIYAEEAAGRLEAAKALQETLYAAARERKSLASRSAADVRAIRATYAARIAADRDGIGAA